MKKVAEKRVAEPQSVDSVATRMIDAPAFTTSIDKRFKDEVKKDSLQSPKCNNGLIGCLRQLMRRRSKKKTYATQKNSFCLIPRHGDGHIR